ncbi:MAG: hypothetical protein WCO23_01170 [bacterium]
MEGTVNLKALFISWWYKEGQFKILNYIKHYFAYIYDMFSIKICLTTLFAVWRNDTATAAYGSSLDVRYQAFLMRQVSRLIGSTIKSVVIFVYLLVAFGSLIFFGLFLIIWLAFPAVIVLLFLVGLGYLVGVL